ncbi:MAG TPA: GDP-mannose 4,6-dehydratase [bacterium]|mgnify:FL=1|nr:GDP-mannose 4,6-dehydratase [bacterium]HPN94945.1 GDP-mannose 4,6-dehydratase [bacterium]
MKRLLVTGGCGVIGSHLVDRMLENGCHVTVVDNLSTGKIENIEHNLRNPNFHFLNSTIMNETMMEELIKDCDAIYHLAAAVGVKYIVDDPLSGILTNVKGTEIVLELAYRYWKRVLFASTSEVYGKSEKVPFQEDTERILGSTKVDRWSYSTAKAVDEHLCFAYHSRGLPVSIVRYFNSYGPRIDERGYGSVVAKFISQALNNQDVTVHGDGTQTRCFTYIEDTVRGTLLTGEKDEAIGDVFNIGNNRETSIGELAQMIIRLTGSKSKIVNILYEEAYGDSYEDTRRRVPDINKAKQRLGFEAQTRLEEGLNKTIEWAKENYRF